MVKMPKTLLYIADRVLNDKTVYRDIENLLKKEMLRLQNESMSHSTFCDILKTPKDTFTKKLLMYFGVNDRQLLEAFQEIGFHPEYKMYGNLYYQTLLTLYYIGVRSDDPMLRLFSLSLIYVKLFNGRKYHYMPNGCQEEIAHYLLQNVMRSSSVVRKYPNPYKLITEYLAPTLDNTYKSYIEKDASHPSKGLIVILMQSWGRMDQIFVRVKDHYYKAVRDGNRLSVDTISNGQGQEVDRLDTTKTDILIDKIQKNIMYHPQKITDKDKEYLKQHYKLSELFLEKATNFLNDGLHDDDIRHIYELLFNIIEVSDQNKLCNLHVTKTIHNVTNKKGTDKEIVKLKKYLETLLSSIFPNITKTASTSSILKLRKALLLILMLRAKRSHCKADFEKN